MLTAVFIYLAIGFAHAFWGISGRHKVRHAAGSVTILMVAVFLWPFPALVALRAIFTAPRR